MDTPRLAPRNLTTLERIATLEGPAQGDDGDYWRELAEWQDWGRWVPPPPDAGALTPDWRQV